MIQALDRPTAGRHEPVLAIAGQQLTHTAHRALDSIVARDNFTTTEEALASCLVTFSRIIEHTANTTMVHVCHGRQIIREYFFRRPHHEAYSSAAPAYDAAMLSPHDLQSVRSALELGISANELFNIAVLTYYDLAPRTNGLIILAPPKRRKRWRSAGVDFVLHTIAEPPVRVRNYV